MATNSQIQERASKELDEYLRATPGRIPTLEDRPNLPYIEAIIREALRWRPPAPLSLQHVLIQDDHYNGCFIPKGAISKGISSKATAHSSFSAETDTLVLPNIL